MSRKILAVMAIAGLVLAGTAVSDHHQTEEKSGTMTGAQEGPKMVDLLVDQLELTEGVEVIVTHVVIPPNTDLPKHWHPGEEFIYVLEGSATLWQKDKPDTLLKKGDLFKVPLKSVHTARTNDEGVTALVFRVHESGQPARTLVE